MWEINYHWAFSLGKKRVGNDYHHRSVDSTTESHSGDLTQLLTSTFKYSLTARGLGSMRKGALHWEGWAGSQGADKLAEQTSWATAREAEHGKCRKHTEKAEDSGDHTRLEVEMEMGPEDVA